MKIENHLESFKEHKETIFDWAIGIKGLKASQRIVGTHASRAMIGPVAIHLLKRNLIDTGTQINHRWFKSKKVFERLLEFNNKEQILSQIRVRADIRGFNIWLSKIRRKSKTGDKSV